MSEELEYCCLCDRVTGRAGIGDDSMSIYNKSYCESCYPDGLLEYITDLEQQLAEAEVERLDKTSIQKRVEDILDFMERYEIENGRGSVRVLFLPQAERFMRFINGVNQ